MTSEHAHVFSIIVLFCEGIHQSPVDYRTKTVKHAGIDVFFATSSDKLLI